MIADTLEQHQRYTGLSPRFAAAFEYLQQLRGDQPAGRYEIDGDNLFAMVQTYTTQPRRHAKVETHRQYIDIQYVQAGRETLLWSPLNPQMDVSQPYAAVKDAIFYATPPHMTPVDLGPGQFVIFFPTDCHAGGLECDGPSEVRKVVIKVRV